MHVARGMNWEQDDEDWRDNIPAVIQDYLDHPDPRGKALKMRQNPLSSWSTEGQVAADFAADCSRGVEARIGMRVPASDIFSLTTTGLGCLSESEVVVIGNPGHVGLGVAMDTSVPKGYDDDDD